MKQLKQEQLTNLLLEKKLLLKNLQEKCDLQSKKIKLYRKENEEIKYSIIRQTKIDTTLLLNSKELSDNNSKLEQAIDELTKKIDISLDSVHEHVATENVSHKKISVVAIQHVTVTEETTEIDLPSQNITDEEILQLETFKNLKSLLLGENKIGNEGFSCIANNLINLEKLQINSNMFTAESMINIAKLENLKILDVRNNKLGDSCMKHLSHLAQLQELSISKNQITDLGIKEVVKLSNLIYLDLTTNSITDEGATSLISLLKLTHLYLMSNRITEKSQLLKLQVLDVRFNINQQGRKDEIKQKKPPTIQLFV